MTNPTTAALGAAMEAARIACDAALTFRRGTTATLLLAN